MLVRVTTTASSKLRFRRCCCCCCYYYCFDRPPLAPYDLRVVDDWNGLVMMVRVALLTPSSELSPRPRPLRLP